jgi:hypothetical protein
MENTYKRDEGYKERGGVGIVGKGEAEREGRRNECNCNFSWNT